MIRSNATNPTSNSADQLSSISNRFLVFFFTPLFLIGIGFFSWGIWDIYEGWSSTTWPKGPGIVTQSYVFTSSKSVKYPKIRYAYSWADQAMEGTEIQLQETHGRRSLVQETLGEYPVGKKVDVFVNPSNPKRAVLEPGLVWSELYLKPLFGIIWMVGISRFLLFIRKGKSSETEAKTASHEWPQIR